MSTQKMLNDFGVPKHSQAKITSAGVRFEYKPKPGVWEMTNNSWFAFEVPKDVILALAEKIKEDEMKLK